MERTPCDRHVRRLKLVGRRIWQNWTLFRPEDFVGAEEHRTETNVVIYDKKEENTHQDQPVLDLIHRHRADCHCHPWGPTLATLARTRPAACSGCSGGVSEASKAASEQALLPDSCHGRVRCGAKLSTMKTKIKREGVQWTSFVVAYWCEKLMK